MRDCLERGPNTAMAADSDWVSRLRRTSRGAKSQTKASVVYNEEYVMCGSKIPILLSGYNTYFRPHTHFFDGRVIQLQDTDNKKVIRISHKEFDEKRISNFVTNNVRIHDGKMSQKMQPAKILSLISSKIIIE